MSTEHGGTKRNASHARLLFLVLTTAGLLGFVLSPTAKRLLGINDHGMWFLDSYAVLAGSDAALQGLDASTPNPLDVFRRPHSYPDWWFGLGHLGLTRENNFAVGATWVVTFLLVVWWTLRPRNWGNALWFSAMLLAPPVLLAINRANNDLVVFVLLGIGAMLLSWRDGALWPVTVALIAIATGLKIYPAVAAAVLLLLQPRRRRALACASAAVAVGAVLLNIFPAIGRSVFTIPKGIYVFGADVLLADVGWTGPAAKGSSAIAILLLAFWFRHRRRTVGLASWSAPSSNVILFTFAAVLLLGCFLAGTSYGYRWIFALWLLPWLIDQAAEPEPSALRRCARFTQGLVMALLWGEGVFCVITNLTLAPMTRVQLDSIQLAGRFVTQPFVWLLMALLAGWLLDLLIAAIRSREPTSVSTPT
jgi:hypothetical protein